MSRVEVIGWRKYHIAGEGLHCLWRVAAIPIPRAGLHHYR